MPNLKQFCECEHIDHFEGKVHDFMKKPLTDKFVEVQTPFGMYPICLDCRKLHLTKKDYPNAELIIDGMPKGTI